MQAYERVCLAMVKHVELSVLGSNIEQGFRVIHMPPDGFCGWHGINVAADADFRSVERKANGYAVCNQRVKEEEDRAKQYPLFHHHCSPNLFKYLPFWLIGVFQRGGCEHAKISCKFGCS